ncbi:MAG: hypothetical protein KJ698_01360 [Actinobacteria bacterium]|nr:hypothetical protein [Actinomycetota bacterium]MBU1492789.1 hypothetical protein [Actinomycetota bacterium]
MEQKHEASPAAAFWESVPAPGPSIKVDNRAYLVSAYADWTLMANRRPAGTAPVEEQIVPDAYAAGYRTPMG